MGHWVTLDNDQHVYISDSGKVLATHGEISSAGRQAASKGRPHPGTHAIVRDAMAAHQRAMNKAQIGSMKARYAREDAIKAKLKTPQKTADYANRSTASGARPDSGLVKVQHPSDLKFLAKREEANKAMIAAQGKLKGKPGEATVGAGKMVHQGYSKEGLAIFGPEGGKPESSRGESFPRRKKR